MCKTTSLIKLKPVTLEENNWGVHKKLYGLWGRPHTQTHTSRIKDRNILQRLIITHEV